MVMKTMRLASECLLTGILAFGVVFAASAEQPLSQRQADFARVETLEQQRSFAHAASALAAYIQTWLKDPKDVVYLINHYRLAVDNELAGSDALAAVQYDACLRHPRIDEADSVFDGRSIRELARERLNAIESRTKRRPLAVKKRVSYEYSGKDGILREVRALRTVPRQLSAMEMLEVASRAMRGDEIASAAMVSRNVLSRTGISNSAVAQDGHLVVAVLPAGPSEAKNLARQLGEAIERIRDMYGLKSAERVVYVYANLDYGDEGIGQTLSTAVHYDRMEDLEGFFNPLDNSIVLRKNIFVGGNVFALGTAYHELMHAAIYEDVGTAPTWLDEGLASLQEEQDASGPIDNYRLYFLRASPNLPSMIDVLDSEHPGWNDLRQPLFAAYSRYLSLYLWNKSAGPKTLRDVYERSKNGIQSRAASIRILEEITAESISQLESSVVNFIQARDLLKVDRKWGQLRPSISRWVETVNTSPTIR
jgi:hypothetical protein